MAGEVTVLGLGQMGWALAAAFLAAGHPTTVWNRTAGKSEGAVERGARPAPCVRDAMVASPLVVLCLLDFDSVCAVLDEAGDGMSGRVVVNLTTVTPEQARRLGHRVAGAGGRYLGGGIMAVPPTIATPSALVLYSGSHEAFVEHRTTLEALGAAEYLGPDPGSAALYDAALLSAMYGMFGGFLHGAALVGAGDESGAPAARFAALASRWLTAMTAALPRLAAQIDAREFSTAVSTLGMQAVAFDNLVAAAGDLGLPTDLLAPLRARIEQAVRDGHADDSLARLVEAPSQRDSTRLSPSGSFPELARADPVNPT